MDAKEKWFRKIAESTLPFFKRKNIPAESLVLLRIIFALLVAFIFLSGSYLLSIVFLTIYQFIIFFDYVDGKLARHQKRFSIKWVKIDFFFHYFISFAFILTLSISYYARTMNMLSLIIGLTGSFLILLSCLFGMGKFNEVRIKRKFYKGKFSNFYSYVGIDNPFSLFYFLIILNLIFPAIVFYSFLYLLILIRKIR